MMNKLIWVPDKEYEWILAEIVDVKGENIKASLSASSRNVAVTGNLSSFAPSGSAKQSGSFLPGFDIPTSFDFSANINAIFDIIPSQQITLNRKQSCKFDTTHLENLDDVCYLRQLHEGPLLHILRRRWLEDQIYTYANDILIAINPYRTISGLYDNPLEYVKASKRSTLKPHIYAVANSALRSMCGSPETMIGYLPGKKNQSIIISGESGSGKTETAKHIVSFLLAANGVSAKAENHFIDDVILDTIVVLESFGNAKTIQNNNSSRFGKYLKLQYTKANRLVSASTEAFMLEKSRLVSVGKDERNYHVFYRLLYGMDMINPTAKADMQLGNIEDYKILSGGPITLNKTIEAKEFATLYDALLDIGCTEDDLYKLWKVLAAVLHLGNITFQAADNTEGMVGINISTSSITHVAKLLGVPENDLKRALTTHAVHARTGAPRTKVLNVAESIVNINGLIKRLYQSIFAWILHTINKYHELLLSGEALEPVKYIGILDVFGFENVVINSFDQLCINYASERLHQQFNDLIFDSEQEIYLKDGIPWSPIYYQDNSNVIDLIGKKPLGLMNILEEHCLMARQTDDMALLSQYHQLHGNNPDRIYFKPRFGNDPSFMIRHYAGSVSYHIDGFISKNNDYLHEDLTDLMQISTNDFLLRILAASSMETEDSIMEDTMSPRTYKSANDRAKSKSAMAASITISASVRHQLDAVLAGLQTTNNHYIKCIKPNDTKSGNQFQSSIVMKQLQYNDLIDVIRIRRSRYKYFMKFSEFYYRYGLLLYQSHKLKGKDVSNDENEAKRLCKLIVDKYMPEESYQFGRHLIFLREHGYNDIQGTLISLAEECVIVIQCNVRRHIVRKAYLLTIAKERQRKQEQAKYMALDEEEKRKANELKAMAEQLEFERAKRLLESNSMDDFDMKKEISLRARDAKDELLRQQLQQAKKLENNSKKGHLKARRERESARKLQKRETIRRRGRLYDNNSNINSDNNDNYNDNYNDNITEGDASEPTDSNEEKGKDMKETRDVNYDNYGEEDDSSEPVDGTWVDSAKLQSKDSSKEEVIRRRSPARLEEERKIRKEVELRRKEDIKRRAEKKRGAFEEEILRRKIAEDAIRMQAVQKIEKYRIEEQRRQSLAEVSSSTKASSTASSSSSSTPVDEVIEKQVPKTKFEEMRRRAASTSRAEKKQNSWTQLVNQAVDDVTVGFVPSNDWSPVGDWFSGLWAPRRAAA